MNIKEIMTIPTVIIMTCGAVWYIRLIIKDQVKPVLASWIVLTTTLTLSLITYATTTEVSVASGVLNGVSVLSALGILVTLKIRQKHPDFTLFQKRSMIAAGVIAIIWLVLILELDKSGDIPNILTQLLMIVGYSITAKKLWNAKENTDSPILWWSIVLASISGLITASDDLSEFYAWRSIGCSGLLVYLMYRIEKKYPR